MNRLDELEAAMRAADEIARWHPLEGGWSRATRNVTTQPDSAGGKSSRIPGQPPRAGQSWKVLGWLMGRQAKSSSASGLAYPISVRSPVAGSIW